MSGAVWALTAYDNQLIAGGLFSTAGGVTAYSVAAWDGASWSSIGFSWDPWGKTVYALTVYGGELIVGGRFNTYEGANISAWDGTSWSPLGSGMNWDVLALAVYDNQLIAGGWFTTAGGVPAKCIAAWDGISWSALGSGTSSPVEALTVFDYGLIAGGWFPSAGGVPVNHIAVWDGASWSMLGSGVNNFVNALTIHNNELIAGGEFAIAGNKVSAGVARWTKRYSTAVSITGFKAEPTAEGIALSWLLSADERIEGFRIYRSHEGETAERSVTNQIIDPATRNYLDKTASPGELYRYTLAVLGAESGEVRSAPVEAILAAMSVELFQNRPNPFNPVTTIRYTVQRPSQVALCVYAPSGELVRKLVDRNMPAGLQEIMWDGTNVAGNPVASGVYVYRLTVGKLTLSKKMILLK
jgi:hypothetical protein